MKIEESNETPLTHLARALAWLKNMEEENTNEYLGAVRWEIKGAIEKIEKNESKVIAQ